MKTPTTSQWTLDTTFQMCHLQMGKEYIKMNRGSNLKSQARLAWGAVENRIFCLRAEISISIIYHDTFILGQPKI